MISPTYAAILSAAQANQAWRKVRKGLSTRVKIEGDSIKEIEGRRASWNEVRTTAFSRAR